jgi:hypothetical protein
MCHAAALRLGYCPKCTPYYLMDFWPYRSWRPTYALLFSTLYRIHDIRISLPHTCLACYFRLPWVYSSCSGNNLCWRHSPGRWIRDHWVHCYGITMDSRRSIRHNGRKDASSRMPFRDSNTCKCFCHFPHPHRVIIHAY